MWPWSNPVGMGYQNVIEWFKSRPFSILYVIIIWIVLAVLGFAAKRNCDVGPWQLVLQCNWSMWMAEYKTNFWHFLGTSFTAPWFHNDFVHILFVTLFGFFFPVQSFEAQHGTKATIVIYFMSYVFIVLFNGWLFNTLIAYWPNEKLFSHAFTRGWMGGSVGIFALIGGLSFFSSKRWFIYSLVFAFELFNYFIIGNNIYISFIHITSSTFGWIACWAWQSFSKKLRTTSKDQVHSIERSIF